MFVADTSFPLARHVVGPQNTRTLTVLGWTDDIKILNATLYPDHVQKNTPELMTALFNTGRLWLGAATILPPRHIHDLDSTGVHDLPTKVCNVQPTWSSWVVCIAIYVTHIAYYADHPYS